MRRSIVACALIVASLAGCGASDGACLIYPDICMNGWAEADCAKVDGPTPGAQHFFAGKSCPDIGYTRHCSSAEGPYCYCRPAFQYCP